MFPLGLFKGFFVYFSMYFFVPFEQELSYYTLFKNDCQHFFKNFFKIFKGVLGQKKNQ